MKLERKTMTMNRYNYLTPCVQDTRGKEGATLKKKQQKKKKQKKLQAESQKDNFFPKQMAKRLSKIKKKSPRHTCKDIK